MSRKKAVKRAREELGATPVFLCKMFCIVKLVPNTSAKRTLNLSSGVCPKSITKASLVITKADMPCLTAKVKCDEQNNHACVQTCCSVSRAGGGSRIFIDVPAHQVWFFAAKHRQNRAEARSTPTPQDLSNYLGHCHDCHIILAWLLPSWFSSALALAMLQWH